ncbi:Serine/threonine-protein kinase tel1 [Kluyveromyces marxianus]|nr:Serine/threonine-protein kinase tel1 [Kluyveromyces marxianus]
MLYKLPYETLYPLLSMSFQDSESSIIDPITKARVDIANRIVTALDMYDNGKYGSEFTAPIKDFCSMSVGLASYKLPPKTKFIQLENLNIGNYWLKDLPKAYLPLPTVPFPISCSQDGRRKDRPYITSIDPVVQISSSGLSLPKIATFTLSDGSKHRVLLKGSNDDLRQDAIMEQVFKQVNKILNANTETRKQKLRIRTYEVIPLGPRAGIIEFVANSIPLHNILLELHSNDELSFDKARKIMKAVQNQSIEERVAAYERITEKIKPQFRNFFFQSFVEPHEWYDKRLSYTKGVVTTSIVGYLLGLGDRHLNNILIDKKTGEPIHIDLGVAFDQGKLLPIPELVPFRLTRDIVNGFGVTGVEGVFRKNCERVFKVLQDEKERVMCVLNVLKWDPLYSWKMTPLKKRKLQAKIAVDYEDDEDDEDVGENDDNNNGINASRINGFSNEENNNDESIRALNGVETKLYGEGLSVEAIVQELLASATDTQSLATIYMGWSPFY